MTAQSARRRDTVHCCCRAGEVLRYGFGRTSIAALTLAFSKTGVAAIRIAEEPDDKALFAALAPLFPGATWQYDPLGTYEAIKTIVEFVERPRANIALPLDIRGTDFQRRVWAMVMKVPFGQTTTFSKVALAIGAPCAVRAIGNACSRNPLEFAIPCHRVLRSNGSYSGGSRWGDTRQATIVRREAEWSLRGIVTCPRGERLR
jgi:AraC family transcriptional regulator of adaptative response/methylated-DNA-[protein]-cysteine methyltransferase